MKIFDIVMPILILALIGYGIYVLVQGQTGFGIFLLIVGAVAALSRAAIWVVRYRQSRDDR